MMRSCALAIGAVVVLGLLLVWDDSTRNNQSEVAAAPAAPVDGAKLSYTKDVKPILENRCFGCHNASKKKAGVDLQSSFASMVKNVKPGSAEDSRLYKSLIGKGAKQMPPRNKIPEDEINVVKAWIAAGAKNN